MGWRAKARRVKRFKVSNGMSAHRKPDLYKIYREKKETTTNNNWRSKEGN